MKPTAENQGLPNDIQALCFVCRCFDVGEKELNRMLETKRAFNPEPYARFPKAFSRTMLMRARESAKKRHDPLRIIQREALYDRICRQNGEPLCAFVADLTDKLASSLLNQYERLLPKLNTEGIARPEALWLLVENVFVPTVFVELVTKWQLGLGVEFRGDQCWYLPLKTSNKVRKPVPSVLDRWLRVAGFRTAYGISQKMGGESLRRSVDRWLQGKKAPTLSALHSLVDNFADEVSWLDEPDTWKARFTFAYAVEKICDSMDEFFKSVHASSSLKLTEMIRQIPREGNACDGGGYLASSHRFFAARLLQRRLQAEQKWNPRTQPPTGQGDWFLETIREMAVSDGFVKRGRHPVEDDLMLDEYLFEIGIGELNRLFDAKRKRADG